MNRVVEAYQSGDIETFNNAAAVYDEIVYQESVTDTAPDIGEKALQAEEVQAEDVKSRGLDFIVPHDGTQPEVTDREQQLVAGKFQALIGDILLNHIDDVKHFKASGPEDSLLLRLDTEDPNVFYSVGVRKKTDEYTGPMSGFEDSDHTREEISIQKIEGGFGRDYFGWRLKADGVVRRWTGGDMYAKRQEEKALGVEEDIFATDNMTPGQLQDHIQAKITELREVIIPNSKLEQNMGLNNQPISLDEFTGLARFLSSYEMKSRSI